MSFRSARDAGALYQVMLARIANLKGIRTYRNHHKGLRISTDNLISAVTASEVDYLAFGNHLNQLYERTNEVSKAASSLMGLTMGERLNAQIRGLNEVFDRMKILASEPGQGVQAFTVILELAKQLEKHLLPMANIVGTLQALSTLIKIEIARVGVNRDGFGALSEEVIALAETIRDKSLPMIDQSSSLTKLVEENLARILGFEERQEEKIRLIRERIMANLGSLTERHEIASIKLHNIATTWEEITHSIGEIVSAMQFHDITRQRIEHVSEALIKTFNGDVLPGNGANSRIAPIAYLKRTLSGFLPFPTHTDMAEAYQNCLLQKAQLLHTKEDLISAGERIRKSLQTLANRIGKISGEAREVTEHARGSKSSFFSEMEKATIFVTEAINVCSEINEQTTTAVERFTTAITQMEGFLKGIVKIGIEMKMVSLNAAIHAAQFGEEGLALGVLADYLHESSQSTSKQIGVIGEDLQTIFENAAHLKSRTALVSRQSTEESRQMVAELKSMIPSLQRLNEEAMSLLERIEGDGDILSSEIRSGAGELRFHGEILQGINELASDIDAACMRMERGLIQKQNTGWLHRQSMEAQEHRYTMQRERDVHQSMLGLPNTEERGDLAEPEPDQRKTEGMKQEEDLGENVELF